MIKTVPHTTKSHAPRFVDKVNKSKSKLVERKKVGLIFFSTN